MELFVELEAYFVGTLHTDGNNSQHLVPCAPSMYCDKDIVGFFLILDESHSSFVWVQRGYNWHMQYREQPD